MWALAMLPRTSLDAALVSDCNRKRLARALRAGRDSAVRGPDRRSSRVAAPQRRDELAHEFEVVLGLLRGGP